MKDQVLSYEQMKELEKLGFDTSDASATYLGDESLVPVPYKEVLEVLEDTPADISPAYTFQDILSHLPDSDRVKIVMCSPSEWETLGFEALKICINNGQEE